MPRLTPLRLFNLTLLSPVESLFILQGRVSGLGFLETEVNVPLHPVPGRERSEVVRDGELGVGTLRFPLFGQVLGPHSRVVWAPRETSGSHPTPST